MAHHKHTTSGFALLMALIVVSVVVSVGLTVLDLTIKQLRLSTNSKDSETAFHAANAGLECARYWRVAEAADMELGLPIVATCFGAAAMTPTITTPVFTGADARLYTMQTTWGPTGSVRCSVMRTLVLVSDNISTTTVTNMQTVIPGYPYGATKACSPGGRCTVLSIQGYSRGCSDISLEGTVQREVLLEL